jgi:hypothetical protein
MRFGNANLSRVILNYSCSPILGFLLTRQTYVCFSYWKVAPTITPNRGRNSD